MKSRTSRHLAIRRLARIVLSMGLVAGALTALASPAVADNTTVSYDNLRTGWDPNEPSLSPSAVAASDFGQLFSTPVDGQVYAQPISVGGTLVVATENNNVYGLNLVTGAVKWSRNVGPAWPASTLNCGDLVPNIGITATPVYDPATGSLYFTSKVNDGASAATPHWYMHAVDPATGVERSGWPVVIQGTPTNNPGNPFNPKTAMQRPGLLLLGGVVYAGFASHCDYGPYVGYVVGVKTATPSISTLWATETGSSTAEAGIWQSGGGLISDGAGQIIFTTGNGVSPAPGPGKTPPTTFGESVVRLAVGANGTLSAKDYFSPANNTGLDTDDSDLGSGAPLAIPDGFGTAAHPHLLVQVGKDGRVFLLDRDNLGGTAQGPGGTDAALGINSGAGVWGHPAFYGGTDGGYVYTVENSSYLRASKIGVDGKGLPSLTSVATSSDTFGYTSGSAVVTSNGTTAGSGLIWVVRASGPAGSNGQLRAYNAVPQNGKMNLVYSASIGTASKFAVPATDNGRVYVGTRDGHVFGFGRPAASALTAAPANFGSVPVGTTSSRTLTITATKALTVSKVTTAAPFTAAIPGGTATLAAGASLAVPVTFTPTAAGAASGTASFTTSAGTVGFDLNGVGTQAGLAASPAAIDFGTIPTGANKTLSTTITNTGATAATITSTIAPTGAFSVSSLPAAGTTIGAGASVSISVKYAPTAAATPTSSVRITGSTGSVTVGLTGTSITGGPQLTITPNPLAFGAVLLGTTASATFDISNTGNTNLTIQKAAPPVGVFNTTTPVAEGQQIVPDDSVQQKITYTPTATGASSAAYLITGNDGRGPQNEPITGVAGLVDNFIGQASGRCMDVSNGAAVDGTAIWIYDCNGSAAQTWRVGAGNSLRALGLCLDVVKGATANASPVQLYTCNGSAAQQWQISAAGTVKNTASGRCLSPAGGISTLTTRLQIVDCNGSAAQVWQRPQRTGPMVGVASKRCLDLTGSSTADNTPVQLYDCNGTAAQSWSIAGGGTVQALGRCLDVRNSGTANGTAVQIYTCNGSTAQQWRLRAGGILANPRSGRCLAPVAGGTANGTRMQLLDCASVPSQTWSLT